MAKQMVKSWKQLLSDSSEHTDGARTGSGEVGREEGGGSEEGGRRVRGEAGRVVEEDKRERRKKYPRRDTVPSEPGTQPLRQSRPSGSHSDSINGDPLMHKHAVSKTPPPSTLAPPPTTSVCVSPGAQAGPGEGGRGTAVSGLPPAGQRKRKGMVCGVNVDFISLSPSLSVSLLPSLPPSPCHSCLPSLPLRVTPAFPPSLQLCWIIQSMLLH